MFSFSAPRWRRNVATESHYNDKKNPRGSSKFLQSLKSCFGHGFEVNIPPRNVNEYQRAGNPATGFEGEEVYGIQAEYLDEDDMAWGKNPRNEVNDGATDRTHDNRAYYVLTFAGMDGGQM